MKWINNISLKYKLIGLVLLVTIAVTFAGYAVIIVRFANEQERKFQSNVETNAILLADYCVGPMSFNDSIETRNVLQRIENLPHIISARVYDKNNRLFSEYIADTAFNNHTYEEIETEQFKKSITYKNIEYGNIVLLASKENISSEISSFMLSNAGWILFLLLLGSFAAYRMQFVITRPLASLAMASKRISQEADYSIRLHREGKDEIATVYNAFNNMLTQIEKRDEARNAVELKLQKAKEDAERADQLKTSFLTNMSHEIRTPMNAILGFTNLMLEESLTPKQEKKYLKVINESGATLLNLVNDILDISKIESGELSIAEGICDINALFSDLFVSFNEIKSQKKKAHLELYINNPLNHKKILLKTDPFRLRQVLVNLLNNAIKFTDSGHIEYGLKENDDSLVFYVKDTGIGIDNSHINEIFKRFRKIDDKKTRLYRGAGLGLAISQDIVTLLGGKFHVESEPGEGSVFSFSLPKILAEKQDFPDKKDDSGKTDLDLMGKTVLIAEDEPNNFKFLNQLLQKYNATIIWARDGQEAINQVERQKTDLILMDIKMPVLDGFEATKRIKEQYPEMIIIAQTAYASTDVMRKCKSAGCDYFVSKPIKKTELIKALKQASIRPNK
ncbi:Autoinducer 2 sensor kinase/phosphatase LuxQ [Salinivirga cyanobacteriivorans]|uniref:histidine kinase n=1 Tax=Salinivirga cyanobacteriivorans TaxID=1307839 RepID=A0A0S2I0L0_9BACT|nr:response regulator [Salinivirga cyanobacteriivorans]ALO15825.1 Autoinducer 2 sensor kinase/phosphatase LuxQ [Salinivirga cyanobacteriivorans]